MGGQALDITCTGAIALIDPVFGRKILEESCWDCGLRDKKVYKKPDWAYDKQPLHTNSRR